MSELVTITAEDRKEITQPALNIVARARDFKVTDGPTYEEAGGRLKEIKAAQKLLEVKKQGILGPALATVKAIRNLFADPESQLEQAENLYKRGMLAYSDEQDRIREEEQRKANEKAERERLRLEKEAREAEERARAAREAGNIRQAEKLEAKADLKTDAAASTVAPIIQREAPRVAGVATRENWSALVIDLKALVDAVAAGAVPLSMVEANMTNLNKMAKALKKELNYPGVRAVVDKVLAAGSK
jgi:hypothetical protein